MSALTGADRLRLCKLLGMLGSDHAGERDAAGLAAHQLIRKRGLTWQDALIRESPKREPLFSTWRTTCAELMKRPGDLRPWERKFVTDLPAFPRISTKQRYILFEIYDRVTKREAA
jgi:hypothetical protein